MPFHNGIYYQIQKGGLCRLHSINGYFSEEKISELEFNEFINEYDKVYKKKFNINLSCKNFDIVSSDQKNIISFILKKYNIYTKYFSINELYNKCIIKNIVNILDGDYFFIFNENHIWGCRRKVNYSCNHSINLCNCNNWYRVDSLNGVNNIDINSLSYEKNIGFIVPVNIKKEFIRNIELLQSILKNINKDTGEYNTINKNTIIEFLIQKNKENKILGDLEVPLSICMDILETNLKNKQNYIPIKNYVKKYNEFLEQFTNGKYNDINLILNFLPDMIDNLVSLNTNNI